MTQLYKNPHKSWEMYCTDCGTEWNGQTQVHVCGLRKMFSNNIQLGVAVEKINHPEHYGGDTVYEAIKVIEAWELGFCLGNTVKYIRRADHKGTPMEDLEKAKWYLDREIEKRRREIDERTYQGSLQQGLEKGLRG